MRLRFLSLLLPGLLLGMPGVTMAEYIPCPLEEIESDVTTAKPPGWWSTPKVGRLQGTDIVQMGDQPVLLCYYGVGSITRDAPPGTECEALERGFRCQAQAMGATVALRARRLKRRAPCLTGLRLMRLQALPGPRLRACPREPVWHRPS